MRGPHCAWGIDLSNLNRTSSGAIIGYGPDFPQRNIAPKILGRRRRRDTAKDQIIQLSNGSVSETSMCYSEDNDDIDTTNIDLNGMRYVYRDETRSKNFFTYDPKPMEFRGRRGTTRFFEHIPTTLQLFELFWPRTLLQKIVIETNHYATHPLNVFSNTMGGRKWVNIYPWQN
jgi:hypothetical protein